MKITALVENISDCDLESRHGLSLYIETPEHRILFDLGPDAALINNCKKLNIDLSKIDTVIISHGHDDHGGALEKFLKVNSIAKIYIQKKAFENHYGKLLLFKFNVGLDAKFIGHPQVVLVDGDHRIDDELELFTVKDSSKCHSPANDVLYTDKIKDDFSHEQNLIIKGVRNVLITGCGHAGIVNILGRAAGYEPKVCVGGYHLFNPINRKTAPDELLGMIAEELSKYDIKYYTCHCTGQAAFNYLEKRLPDMSYLSCGKCIEI